MTEVIKTIKAYDVVAGMRIRYDRGPYDVEGDVKSAETYGGSLIDVTFERGDKEAGHLIPRTQDVDVLRVPVPDEPQGLGAVVKRYNAWGGVAHFVRAKAGAPGYYWSHAAIVQDCTWDMLTANPEHIIEILSDGVNVDD